MGHSKKQPPYNKRLHGIWWGMMRRCGLKKNYNEKEVRLYRDRGITVCEEWRKWRPFRDWALANGYSDDLTIDRIDNDGNYCPENCRWVSPTVNKRNTCRAYKVKCVDAATGAVAVFPSLADACEIIGVDSGNVIRCFKNDKYTVKGFFWSKVED